jgi:membrane protease YdiL (CAAX protease family)
VSQPDELTPALVTAYAVEIAFLICGLWLLWRLVLRPAARAARQTRLPEWRLPPIDFACFIFFGLGGAVALSGAAGLITRHIAMSSDSATIIGSAVMEGGLLLGMVAFFVIFAAVSRSPSGRPALVPALTSGLATFLIAAPLVDAVNAASEYLITRLGFPNERQEMVDIFENMHSAAMRCLFAALAIILVPAAEEVFFRGGLFRYFRTRVPRWAAIGLTSALFGALHVAWGKHMVGLPSLLPLSTLAAVFCLAYERTGMIGTVIVAHALFNLNSMFEVVMGAAR